MRTCDCCPSEGYGIGLSHCVCKSTHFVCCGCVKRLKLDWDYWGGWKNCPVELAVAEEMSK